MKGLYTALKCFMLEFWDLKQYGPTWNTTTLDYLSRLPRNAEARCIHMPDSTRICQLKVRGLQWLEVLPGAQWGATLGAAWSCYRSGAYLLTY